MKISMLEECGLRCLSQLARADGKMTIGEIATNEHFGEDSTAKVMGRLRATGLVRSIRGKGGGYVLARPAARISLAEVFEALQGSFFELERCHRDSCVHEMDCSLRPVLSRLEEMVREYLSSLSIADLDNQEARVSAHLDRRAPIRETPLVHPPVTGNLFTKRPSV